MSHVPNWAKQTPIRSCSTAAYVDSGVLEPIPPLRAKAECTQDKPPAYYRANTEWQTSTHTLTLTPTGNLELPINQRRTSLGLWEEGGKHGERPRRPTKKGPCLESSMQRNTGRFKTGSDITHSMLISCFSFTGMFEVANFLLCSHP